MAERARLGYAGSMSLRTTISLLRRHALFARLEPARLEVIAFTAEHSAFEPGEMMFEEGEEAYEALLVLEGQAVMSVGDGPDMAVDVGDLLGEMVLLQEGFRRATVRAVTRVETLNVSRYLFQRLMQEFPEMAGAVAQALAQRLSATGNEMMQLATRLAPAQKNDQGVE